MENWGAESVLSVNKPYVERSDEFSLSQIWISGGEWDPKTLETVEAGWTVNWAQYGDYETRSFIYFTPDSYKEGGAGCWNLGCGFVQVDESIVIGAAFANIPDPGQPGWVYVKLGWARDPATGNWWLHINDDFVGYYGSELFDASGLKDIATEAIFGGEIVDHQPNGRHTKTQMGSGSFPVQYLTTATQQTMYFINPGTMANHVFPGLYEFRTDPLCYEVSLNNGGLGWYFNFGGAGYHATQCQ